MSDLVTILVNGRALRVSRDISLAAALLNEGDRALRKSVQGFARGPVCGMGTCFECRVTIDGDRHRRACLEPVVEGMTVDTLG